MGAFLGTPFYVWVGRTLFGHNAGLPSFLFGITGFFVVFYLWERFVPIRCTQCGGRMKKKYGLGKQVHFTCAGCGWQR